MYRGSQGSRGSAEGPRLVVRPVARGSKGTAVIPTALPGCRGPLLFAVAAAIPILPILDGIEALVPCREEPLRGSRDL